MCVCVCACVSTCACVNLENEIFTFWSTVIIKFSLFLNIARRDSSLIWFFYTAKLCAFLNCDPDKRKVYRAMASFKLGWSVCRAVVSTPIFSAQMHAICLCTWVDAALDIKHLQCRKIQVTPQAGWFISA